MLFGVSRSEPVMYLGVIALRLGVAATACWVPAWRAARTILLDRQRPPRELCSLLLLGIQGFVPYNEVETSLSRAIYTVSQGHMWIPSEVLEQYVRDSNSTARIKPNGHRSLTCREKHIVELLHRRLSNKEISSIAGISESTVKFHLSNIFTKLAVYDRYSVADVMAPDSSRHVSSAPPAGPSAETR